MRDQKGLYYVYNKTVSLDEKRPKNKGRGDGPENDNEGRTSARQQIQLMKPRHFVEPQRQGTLASSSGSSGNL